MLQKAFLNITKNFAHDLAREDNYSAIVGKTLIIPTNENQSTS